MAIVHRVAPAAQRDAGEIRRRGPLEAELDDAEKVALLRRAVRDFGATEQAGDRSGAGGEGAAGGQYAERRRDVEAAEVLRRVAEDGERVLDRAVGRDRSRAAEHHGRR